MKSHESCHHKTPYHHQRRHTNEQKLWKIVLVAVVNKRKEKKKIRLHPGVKKQYQQYKKRSN